MHVCVYVVCKICTIIMNKMHDCTCLFKLDPCLCCVICFTRVDC